MTKLVKELMSRITSLEQTVKCQENTIRILNKNVDELQIVCRPKKNTKAKSAWFSKTFLLTHLVNTHIMMFAKQ